ncbi:hypothetical protein GCM10011385_30190 [Nitratireductor aestuarii]|uniref:Uncharacterized protein n=1 Tax=Nitratireductor aestuarii TaxID=1735103 RepID=A0A916RWE1_9HYPH|nr:hypothetical protein GCM10011385_30190 [Nitratireductor aestuarii]
MIGKVVIGDVLKNSYVPNISGLVRNDVHAALSKGEQTVGTWGGSSFYWNMQLSDDPKDTVGNSILKDPAEYEKFLSVTSKAMLDTAAKFGITAEQALTALEAQLPAEVVSELVNRVIDYMDGSTISLAGDPERIDGFRTSEADDGSVSWYQLDKDLKRTYVTDPDKVKELNQRREIRLEKGADENWQKSEAGSSDLKLAASNGNTYALHLDGDGKKTSATVTKADGSRIDREYQPNSALGQKKPRYERTYDAHGHMTEERKNLDDGSYTSSTELAAAERAAAEKAEAERAAAESQAAQIAAAERAAAEKAEAERVAAESQAAQIAAAERAAAEKAEAERAAAASQAAQIAAAEKAAAEKAEAERAAAERAAAQIAAAEEARRSREREQEHQRLAEARQRELNQRLQTPPLQINIGSVATQRPSSQYGISLDQPASLNISVYKPPEPPAPEPKLKIEFGQPGQGNFSGGGNVNLPAIAPIPQPRPNLDVPIYKPAPSPGSGSRTGSGTGIFIGVPVLLDLDADGTIDVRPLAIASVPHQAAEAEAPASTTRFDWNSDCIPDPTAWVGPNDGLLAIDLAIDGSAGANGKIDQAKEIAFALWKSEEEIASENADAGSSHGARLTDLEGLRRYFDTNRNNVLDAADDRWSEFRVWRDANQNGVADAGELRTMADVGIKLISLMPASEGARAFSDGSSISGTSYAEMNDGTRMLVGDVALASRPGVLAQHAA